MFGAIVDAFDGCKCSQHLHPFFMSRGLSPWVTFLHEITENRMTSDAPVFIAGHDHLALVRPPIEEFLRCADAASDSIIEQLAAPDAADIEFEAPSSGRLFRAADFS